MINRLIFKLKEPEMCLSEAEHSRRIISLCVTVWELAGGLKEKIWYIGLYPGRRCHLLDQKKLVFS